MPSSKELEPLAVTVEEASTISTLSRSRIYELLNKGLIEGRYEGRKRLVLYRSLCEYIERLPEDAPAA